jgi:hypothetical protein
MKHTFIRRRLLALFAVSAFFCANEPADAQWHYRATREFVIAYTPPDASSSVQTLGLLQQTYQRLRKVFQDSLKAPIVVFICAERQTFNSLSGEVAPDWGDGLADLTNRRILLLSPNATAYRRPLADVVAHELIHSLMHDLVAGAPLPTWLAEGAAIYYAGEVQHSDPILISRAILTNSLIAFDELDQVLKFEAARANLAYQESYQSVRFLIQRHGDTAVRDICKKLAGSAELNNAFKEAFGEDLIDFETGYFDWLRQNYRWQFLVDASTITWAVIVFLLALAIVAVRWRTRRKIAEWEKEDEAAATPEAGNCD